MNVKNVLIYAAKKVIMKDIVRLRNIMLQNATLMLHQKAPTLYAVVGERINTVLVIIVTKITVL